MVVVVCFVVVCFVVVEVGTSFVEVMLVVVCIAMDVGAALEVLFKIAGGFGVFLSNGGIIKRSKVSKNSQIGFTKSSVPFGVRAGFCTDCDRVSRRFPL